MKSILEVCLLSAGVIGIAAAQDPTKPVLREGISVQMPALSEAVAIPAAEELDTTVVTVTAEGRLFVGVQPVELKALAGLPAQTVYVKADARVPYQQVLTVLDTLHEHTVVLLTAPTTKVALGGNRSAIWGAMVAQQLVISN